MAKKLIENPIKKLVRNMLLEGELENAESTLAAKDFVDRLQDMVVELGKMSNDELPHLVDSIRGSFSPEQAQQYQTTTSAALSELLDLVKQKKGELENATLALAGESPAEGMEPTNNELELPGEGEEALDGEDLLPDEEGPAKPNPLGREPRIPTEESRRFNKRLTEAKIIALDKALKETNARKTPLRAARLAEELRRLVTEVIKEESKSKKKKGKPEWLLKKELAAEKKDKKKVDESKEKATKKNVIKAKKKSQDTDRSKCMTCKKNPAWGKSAFCEACLKKKDKARMKGKD